MGLTLDLDYPALYTFTALAQDDLGASTWATQEVAVVSCPVHWLVADGFRTNGKFKLCMAGEAGSNYLVLATTDLNSTNWTPVVAGTEEGFPGLFTEYMIVIPKPVGSRFYRLRAE